MVSLGFSNKYFFALLSVCCLSALFGCEKHIYVLDKDYEYLDKMLSPAEDRTSELKMIIPKINNYNAVLKPKWCCFPAQRRLTENQKETECEEGLMHGNYFIGAKDSLSWIVEVYDCGLLTFIISFNGDNTAFISQYSQIYNDVPYVYQWLVNMVDQTTLFYGVGTITSKGQYKILVNMDNESDIQLRINPLTGRLYDYETEFKFNSSKFEMLTLIKEVIPN